MRIGLSLGGGSLRGTAHIGVLKELVRRKTEITHLAGTSAGAVVAGLYACGASVEDLERFSKTLSVRKYLDFHLGKRGLLKGDRIYETLLEFTQGKHFTDLQVPLAVCCVDLVSGEEKIIRSGEVATAIRASIAIPGIFSPVETQGQILVDGYILNNNPVDVVKQMGAEYVVAVRVNHYKKYRRSNVLTYLSRYQHIASEHMTEQKIREYADLLIDMDLSRVKLRSFRKLVEEGELETRRVLDSQWGTHDCDDATKRCSNFYS